MHSEPDPTASTTPRLTVEEENWLLRRIDAGTIASAALDGRFPTATDARVDELRLIAADGERARDALIRANVGLVWFVARATVERTGQPRGDLFQEGMIGLLESIPRFDPARGNFASCALPWIRMRIGDAAVTNLGALGLSARRARQWRRARAAAASLTVALARTPSVEEVADETGETARVVRTLMSFTPALPLDRDDPRWLLVQAPPGPPCADGADLAQVRTLLRRLGPFDRSVVTHLYGLDGQPRTHAEVAAATGRSESTVRRAERRALALMRVGAASELAA